MRPKLTPQIADLYVIAKWIDEYGPAPRSLDALCAAICQLEAVCAAETADLWRRYCRRERLSGTGPHPAGLRKARKA